MPKETKPKWGHSTTAWEHPNVFKLEDLEALGSKSKIKVDEFLLDRINNATCKYLSDLETQGPRLSEIKVALKVVSKKTKANLECLIQLDSVSQDLLDAYQYFYSIEPTCVNRVRSIIEDLEKFSENIDTVLNDHVPRDGGGRPPDSPTWEFIIRLADIYEAMTGKKAGVGQHNQYSGPFYYFVDHLLRRLSAITLESQESPTPFPVVKPPFSNTSLGRHISRVLVDRRNRPQIAST